MNSYDQIQKKKRIAARFGAKVTAYGEHAHFQSSIVNKLVPLISSRHKPGSLWLDVGCGNGMLARKLLTPSFSGCFIGFDIANSSIRYCNAQRDHAGYFLCADADSPPFRNGCADGVISTSVLQWVPDLKSTLCRINRLLKMGGAFVYAVFTDNAFYELSKIRSQFNLPPSINVPDSSSFSSLLDECGFGKSHDELLTETLYFPSAMHLLKHLSLIGSTAAGSERMSRTELSTFCKAYEETFRTGSGIPLTYTARLGCTVKEHHHV